MNLIIPSKKLLVSALLAVAIVIFSLAVPLNTELIVGYFSVMVLLAMAGLEYRKPRGFRGKF